MKKILILIAVVLLLLGGAYYWLGGDKEVNTSKNETSTDSLMEKKTETAGVVSSIKDAMGLGKKLKCTYTTTEGGADVSSSVVLDGKKFKFTTTVNGERMQGVFDGQTQYLWSSDKKMQGFKMDKSCIDGLTDIAEDLSQNSTEQDIAKDYSEMFDMAQDVKCEAASGEDFSIPSDVMFLDQCEMMKQSAEMLKNLKTQMPDGVKLPNIPGMPTGN